MIINTRHAGMMNSKDTNCRVLHEIAILLLTMGVVQYPPNSRAGPNVNLAQEQIIPQNQKLTLKRQARASTFASPNRVWCRNLIQNRAYMRMKSQELLLLRRGTERNEGFIGWEPTSSSWALPFGEARRSSNHISWWIQNGTA